MTHRFVGTFIVSQFPNYSTKFFGEMVAVIVLVSFVASHLVYFVIEKPCISLASLLCKRLMDSLHQNEVAENTAIAIDLEKIN